MAQAIFSVINLSRKTLGWGMKSADDLKAEIAVWAVTFNDYGIPPKHLEALWKRARDLRISYVQQGKDIPDFTAELLAACWIGANGLKAELEQARINAGRTLTANAASQCPKCFGSGKEFLFDEKGRTQGIVGKCDHQGARKVRG